MHFTHVANLPAILQSGVLKSDSHVQTESIMITECADISIKERRRSVEVPIPPGGVVADYVPFYFAPRSPMMYSISRGNVATYADGQQPLVYFWSWLSVADRLQLPWIASDGNCASSLTSMTNNWRKLEESVDWQIMTAKQWSNTAEDGDRMRRRMAEFLVHREFPFEAFTGAVTRSKAIASLASKHLGDKLPVHVRPDWYY
ncbi:type II toxin-antitoxin system toxin DNA ADP-ribosyl transferase DarT [Actinoalloteichus hymeniacidonis]|uniref:DUF4433 family protein n=1 Tax=Actinoalloteichus hymeniacidonis TaxID=340345 RepID=A0AAC9HUE6_9PSEU|nr:DUF4433 domain-containing protein [Actinoalloteichus hymeniacidonis]AOS65633.1 putative DUF4433 family protein [Actinoalloteichus hymeniacidonis]MBB5906277.1 hypothetical protein [Actinoalloteichus hymeniacidonis]